MTELLARPEPGASGAPASSSVGLAFFARPAAERRPALAAWVAGAAADVRCCSAWA
ncbi:hypothetical protein ACFFV7_47360 [Nonomuraea spiralis]|uniref:Uncharacterized protein n=1 Tax=Nonomuraea spiralis TaxID=46182 RepID=A0ABV5IYQ2_9ACTN|nr:hypothetical protein [Nonomuraea spiralis]GGT46639.1 hypothetical protein GCM10010176_107040 [Nonomuraea spiralis]